MSILGIPCIPDLALGARLSGKPADNPRSPRLGIRHWAAGLTWVSCVSWRVPDLALGTELPGRVITGISGFLNLALDTVLLGQPAVHRKCPGLGLYCPTLVDHLYVLGLPDLILDAGILNHPTLCPICPRLGLGH